MLVEVVLETLIGKVDAELFEAVVLIVLEAKDVQHSNGQDLIMTHSSDSHNNKKENNSNNNRNGIPKSKKPVIYSELQYIPKQNSIKLFT